MRRITDIRSMADLLDTKGQIALAIEKFNYLLEISEAAEKYIIARNDALNGKPSANLKKNWEDVLDYRNQLEAKLLETIKGGEL